MNTDAPTPPPSSGKPGTPNNAPPRAAFPATHWSVVLAAGDDHSPQKTEALETLCGAYWYPIYAHLRRRGHGPEDAQDLTQGFFAHLLEKEFLKKADRTQGKFRSFLLASLEKFEANERRTATAQKRGGGQSIISLDAIDAEERYRIEPADHVTPDLRFDRSWAGVVLDRILDRLRDQYAIKGQLARFERLKHCLAGRDDSSSYAAAAVDLKISLGAVKTTIHRLRQDYRESLREVVAETLPAGADVDDEIRYLFSLLRD